MNKEILSLIKEKGLLLEKEIFDLIDGFGDIHTAKFFLEQLERVSGQRLITRKVLNKNVEYVKAIVKQLPGENKSYIEKVFVNLGISLELKREKEVFEKGVGETERKTNQEFRVFYANTNPNKKLEAKDFTGHFRSRFQQLQKILIGRPELQYNLVSINKISSDRTSLGIIGIVSEKRVTKNKNLIIKFEDLTGEVNVLVKHGNDVFSKAEELQLDDVVGVKANGNRDLLFAHDIFYPDSYLQEKTKFDEEHYAAFLSDVHCGSDRHLGKSFGLLVSYLRKIPSHITIFMCPGQHDATRVAEPQPVINKKYAPGLYELENLVLVTNPAMVKLLENGKEFKILMYHGASIHTFINEIKELREMKTHSSPAKAVKHMLKRRHLAPMYGVSPQVVYVPNAESDPLVISEVPDVLITGEVHRADIENYNGVLIVTGSCWQSQTLFEEKVGNVPVPGKVPVLNLKTRELKIFDFLEEK